MAQWPLCEKFTEENNGMSDHAQEGQLSLVGNAKCSLGDGRGKDRIVFMLAVMLVRRAPTADSGG